MRYRIIATGDVHMSNSLPYARPGPRGITDRLADQLDVWEQIKAHAEREKADAIFVLGDLFDKHLVDPVTLTHTVAALVDLAPFDVYILSGNHEANGLKGERFVSEMFGAMGRDHIHYVGTQFGPFSPREGYRFWPLSYAPMGETLKTLAEWRKRTVPHISEVLLFHQSIIGCRHLEWVCDDGLDAEVVREGFNLVIAGHFHTHQKFPGGFYLGAPMQHHFGDCGEERGVWRIDIKPNGGGYGMKRLPIKAPRFHKVDFTGEDPEAALADAEPGDYVRIQVEATHAEWLIRREEAEALAERYRAKGMKVLPPVHKPVYHHESRMKVEEGKDGTVKIEAALVEYLKSAVTDGLDKARLLEIGREALAAVGAK